jgi:hypothetical protein
VLHSKQTPFTQPIGQATSAAVYWHAPREHTPIGLNVRKVKGPGQNAALGVLQVTPAHGSPRQAPFWQPKVQNCS